MKAAEIKAALEQIGSVTRVDRVQGTYRVHFAPFTSTDRAYAALVTFGQHRGLWFSGAVSGAEIGFDKDGGGIFAVAR